MPQTGPWTGDPVWLADVLRAEGVNPVEYAGWLTRGHGDFKDIRGVMVHHTGSDNASAASIAGGRPDLAGPLSQLHIARAAALKLNVETCDRGLAGFSHNVRLSDVCGS